MVLPVFYRKFFDVATVDRGDVIYSSVQCRECGADREGNPGAVVETLKQVKHVDKCKLALEMASDLAALRDRKGGAVAE